jgi:hypothetical protein
LGKSARRRFIAVLIGILLALLTGEALLAWFDPLGFVYFRDQAYLSSQIVPDVRGYGFRPGSYPLSFALTILPDGTRAVPDTDESAGATLVFVGDSVTFGYGVDDDQTWVNRVARELPGVHIVNAGVSGYNSTNVLRTVAQYPDADALVYLIVNNDAEPENRPDLDPDFGHPRPPESSSWLALYLLNLPEYLAPISAEAEIARGDLPRYFDDLRQIVSDERVLALAFDDAFGRMTVEHGFSVTLIARGTDRVSPADGHPGVRSNQAIAAQVLPLLRERFGL